MKQNAIPGTEDAVNTAETREQFAAAREKQRKAADAKPKARQTSFISGQGRDLPGQELLFDADGIPDG